MIHRVREGIMSRNKLSFMAILLGGAGLFVDASTASAQLTGGYSPSNMPTVMPRWGTIGPNYYYRRQFAFAAMASANGFNQGFFNGSYLVLPPYQTSQT